MIEAIAISLAASFTATTGIFLSAGALSAVTTVTGLGLAIGANVALSYFERSQARTGQQSIASINAPEVRGSVRQSIPTQRIIVGSVRTGGAIYFLRVNPPYLYIGYLYCARRISAVNGLIVGENRIALSSSAFDTIVTPLSVSGMPSYSTRMRACFQEGRLDQPTNPLLRAAFPDLDTDFRLPGIANAVFECHYGADADEFISLWGNVQIPNIEAEIDGIPVYDPRNPSHFLPDDPTDIDQYEAAEASWSFSRLAALNQADFFWQPYGFNAGHDKIDWTAIAETAARDDEMVGLKSGEFEKRYTSDGVYLLSDKLPTVAEALLSANRGFMQIKNGLIGVSSSAPRDPVITITDDMLIGAVEFRSFKAKRDVPTEIQTRFVAPDRAYQESDGPIWVSADIGGTDDSRRAVTLRLPFTTGSARTQRLAKAYFETAILEKSLSCVVDLRALGVEEGDCVRVYSEIYPIWNGLYTVEQWELTAQMNSISLQMISYDPDIENNWNPSVDEKDFTISDVGV